MHSVRRFQWLIESDVSSNAPNRRMDADGWLAPSLDHAQFARRTKIESTRRGCWLAGRPSHSDRRPAHYPSAASPDHQLRVGNVNIRTHALALDTPDLRVTVQGVSLCSAIVG